MLIQEVEDDRVNWECDVGFIGGNPHKIPLYEDRECLICQNVACNECCFNLKEDKFICRLCCLKIKKKMESFNKYCICCETNSNVLFKGICVICSMKAIDKLKTKMNKYNTVMNKQIKNS